MMSVTKLLHGKRMQGAERAAFLLLLLAGCPAPGDRGSAPEGPPRAEEPSWLLAPDPALDLVRASDSEEALRRRLGEDVVRSDTVWVGEGMFEIGTVLFPDDPSRRVQVEWEDAEQRSRPRWVRLEGESSSWRIHPGVGLATTLAQVEELNEGPFRLHGFGWDYAGTSAGWDDGRLEDLWGSGVLLRFRPSRPDGAREREVSGDSTFPSSHPAMRALDPRVYAVLIRPR
jgi:hypothetical protein